MALFHVVLLLYLSTVAVIYFVPAILARNRTHATAIRILNVLVGWTGIGWIALVIWALAASRQPQPVLNRPPA
jgi:Superinfection immunity protein